MKVFEQSNIGNCVLNNRFIRSATYEGACTEDGYPTDEYVKIYDKLSSGEPGLIITGFAHVHIGGRSMQSAQAGFDTMEKARQFEPVSDIVHRNNSRIFVQLAHTGRQTVPGRVGQVVGASEKKSFYFGSKTRRLNTDEVFSMAVYFSDAAYFAKQAGFDGVQLHAAHGYLMHQFMLKNVNNRKDAFGIDKTTGINIRFLQETIDRTKAKCGAEFPVIVKISSGVDYFNSTGEKEFINLVKFLSDSGADAMEISYGTMDMALNIIRGDIPVNLILKVNPMYGGHGKLYNTLWKLFALPVIKTQIKKFSTLYNFKAALTAKKYSSIPVICVGGIRNLIDANKVISAGIDYVSMSRPFICEPDLVSKFKVDENYSAKCISCNYCTIMCDSGRPTRCYKFH